MALLAQTLLHHGSMHLLPPPTTLRPRASSKGDWHHSTVHARLLWELTYQDWFGENEIS